MFVSPRFRDIFSSRSISTRKGGAPAAPVRDEPISDAEFDRRAGEIHVDLIWLEIAHAHRRASRTFTPEFIRAEELASGEA